MSSDPRSFRNITRDGAPGRTLPVDHRRSSGPTAPTFAASPAPGTPTSPHGVPERREHHEADVQGLTVADPGSLRGHSLGGEEVPGEHFGAADLPQLVRALNPLREEPGAHVGRLLLSRPNVDRRRIRTRPVRRPIVPGVHADADTSRHVCAKPHQPWCGQGALRIDWTADGRPVGPVGRNVEVHSRDVRASFIACAHVDRHRVTDRNIERSGCHPKLVCPRLHLEHQRKARLSRSERAQGGPPGRVQPDDAIGVDRGNRWMARRVPETPGFVSRVVRDRGRPAAGVRQREDGVHCAGGEYGTGHLTGKFERDRNPLDPSRGDSDPIVARRCREQLA